MANQKVAMIAVTALLVCAASASAEDESLPKNMLGFLKPGMRVGIRAVEGTTNVFLDVYTDEQYGVALDLAALVGRRSVAATKFADDHPVIRKDLDVFVERLAERSPDANARNVTIFPLLRTSFGSISSIGDDYVLIDREGDTKRRLILARSSIARIDLDAEAVRFIHPSMR